MAVKEYTQYVHYGNGKTYTLYTIALPIENMPEEVSFGRSSAFHTELEEVIEIFNVGNVVFSEKDEFLVLYQQEGNSILYARPVDMFFEHVDGKTKRFQESKEEDDVDTN